MTIARSLTNTFSGIRPLDLPGFIVAELAGAVCALAAMAWLLRPSANADLWDGEGATLTVAQPIRHRIKKGLRGNALFDPGALMADGSPRINEVHGSGGGSK